MRRFKLHRPNEVRLTDVTYLDYGNDIRAYGSASIDPVTGKLICFVISENNDLQLALDTLEAMDSYPLKSGGIIHSDQGILYFTDDFQAAVETRDLIQSMSRRGNCWDNAPQESFFGHFKDECDYKRCRTLKELQAQVDDYRVYYNEKRRLWERMKMTPVEYEAYLEGLDDKAFEEYMKKEEAVILMKKEKSAQAAVEKAKSRKKAIKDRLEEIENETGIKAEV
jgi:transposase InsO family protein